MFPQSLEPVLSKITQFANNLKQSEKAKEAKFEDELQSNNEKELILFQSLVNKEPLSYNELRQCKTCDNKNFNSCLNRFEEVEFKVHQWIEAPENKEPKFMDWFFDNPFLFQFVCQFGDWIFNVEYRLNYGSCNNVDTKPVSENNSHSENSGILCVDYLWHQPSQQYFDYHFDLFYCTSTQLETDICLEMLGSGLSYEEFREKRWYHLIHFEELLIQRGFCVKGYDTDFSLVPNHHARYSICHKDQPSNYVFLYLSEPSEEDEFYGVEAQSNFKFHFIENLEEVGNEEEASYNYESVEDFETLVNAITKQLNVNSGQYGFWHEETQKYLNTGHLQCFFNLVKLSHKTNYKNSSRARNGTIHVIKNPVDLTDGTKPWMNLNLNIAMAVYNTEWNKYKNSVANMEFEDDKRFEQYDLDLMAIGQSMKIVFTRTEFHQSSEKLEDHHPKRIETQTANHEGGFIEMFEVVKKLLKFIYDQYDMQKVFEDERVSGFSLFDSAQKYNTPKDFDKPKTTRKRNRMDTQKTFQVLRLRNKRFKPNFEQVDTNTEQKNI